MQYGTLQCTSFVQYTFYFAAVAGRDMLESLELIGQLDSREYWHWPQRLRDLYMCTKDKNINQTVKSTD